MTHKFRQEQRRALFTPIPVLLINGDHTAEGMLFDAGEMSMGVVVMDGYDQPSRTCTIEICDETSPCCFKGELCYISDTDYGTRLGIVLFDDNDQPLLDYLDTIGATLR